jgi:hypothetical protein
MKILRMILFTIISIINTNRKIFIIDFVDACHEGFRNDLATSIFPLLIDKENRIH